MGGVGTRMKAPTNIAGYDPNRNKGDCEFDSDAAQLAVEFFEDVLTHPDKSPTTEAGDPFKLQPWQRDYIATLFGWKRPNGNRRYVESLLAVPRKNGKTALAAGIALYGLWAENRPSSQVYSAAMDRDQASAIYRTAYRMVRQSPTLSEDLNCVDSTKRITFRANGGFYEALSGDADTGHSRKPFYILFDELHIQKNRKLYDNLQTGFGSTVNRLMVSITTAGYDRHSICWDVWKTARQIRDNNGEGNPYFLPMIYEIGDHDDWQDEQTWAKCNPNLGVSISWEFLREEFAKAKQSPAFENTFRNLYLNEWTEQATRWLSMDKWRLGDGALPDLAGAPCWGGLDLSTTTDISALVLAFPREDGGFYLLCRFWIPKENARQRGHRDGVPYLLWAQRGLVTLTDGDVVDFDVIRRDVNQLREQYNIQEIAIDRWNAAQLTTQLTGDGLVVTPFGQGYASMSPAAKQFEKHVIEGTLQHGGNEVLTWMAGNVAIERDAAGNIKPSKKVSTERIDGIVAAVMAVGRAATAEEVPCGSLFLA